MNIDVVEGNMTVKYYIAICYNGEYIVDISGKTYADYFEKSWYEESYGSKCYDCYIDDETRIEIADDIFNDVINSIDGLNYVEDSGMKETLYNKILEQIDEWDFYLDSETLNIDIDFDYDEKIKENKDEKI